MRTGLLIVDDVDRSRYFLPGFAAGAAAAGSSSDLTLVALTVPLACVKLNWFDFIFALSGVSIVMVWISPGWSRPLMALRPPLMT